jgi:hypothetical protein
MWTLDLFIGVAEDAMFKRRPVGVFADFVNALFGQGSRQSCPVGVLTRASHFATPGSGIVDAEALDDDATAKNSGASRPARATDDRAR